MMQHPCQLRFLFTRDTDTSRYTALKMGRRSETGREKRVTLEFGEYQRRKKSTPNLGCYNLILFTNQTLTKQVVWHMTIENQAGP
jgi:hypothetical protein